MMMRRTLMDLVLYSCLKEEVDELPVSLGLGGPFNGLFGRDCIWYLFWEFGEWLCFENLDN